MATKKELENQQLLNREKEKTLKLNDAISEQASDQIQEFRDLGNLIKSQTNDIKFQLQEKTELVSVSKSLTNLARETLDIENRSLGTSKDISKLKKIEIETERKITQLTGLKNKIIEGTAATTKEINDNIEEQIKQSRKLVIEIQKQESLSKQISENFGVKTFQLLTDTIKSLPGLKILATPFEEAAEAARKVKEDQLILARAERDRDISLLTSKKQVTRELLTRLGLEKDIKGVNLEAYRQFAKSEESQKKFLAIIESQPLKISKRVKSITKETTSLGAAFKSLGKPLLKTFGAVMFKVAAEEILKVNKETVELQKSLALSAGEAADLRNDFAGAAASSENINISTTALLKTVTALSKQFGFPTLFDMETLVTTTKLTEQVGISAESAGMLAAATVTTGKNFEDQYKDALGTSYELQRQSGVQLDLRDILEESGKVTGTIRANLGSNVATIAAAVTQAKLFGGSLNDVANASKALLDFESSITAELEAELLLGKNINLETARQASLNGDMVTVAKELRKEAGDYTEFSKMNVIQQEALAKAMGMQSDQLADILFQQDIQGKTANELRALGKDELADRLEAQTVQEKFNASIAKLKGILGDVVTAFMPILDILGSVFEAIGKVIKVLQPFMGIITGALSGLLLSGGNPIGALIGGVIGAGMDVANATTANDAVIPPGYGDTIVKRGKDTIALNNDDTVVAGTNLGGGSNKTGERTNQLLESLIMQNAKKPELSPVGLYEVQ